MRKQVEIYTDGACSGNPGVGGWGVVMFYRGIRKEMSGAEGDTTNNRMERTALIQGLSALKFGCDATLYSDSAYCGDAFNQGWIYGWQKNGWRTADKSDVKNSDLWQTLVGLTKKHNVTFVKVKGHADNEHNNRCDALARAAIKKYVAVSAPAI